MSVYHQMGHDSKNLLHVPELNKFRGAILSPVNYDEPEVTLQILNAAHHSGFEMIFDPQLYYPQSDRGKLHNWSYFPQDVDTADISSVSWWNNVTDKIVETCIRLEVDGACSPVFAPKSFSNEYYLMTVNIGNYFIQKLAGTSIKPFQSVIIGMGDISNPKRAAEIASIISKTNTNNIYVMLLGTTVPRREFSNTEELKGAMKLINLLENAGLNVTVGFGSSDLVLWKAAGASNCATGKFFNLRRFTSSRFDDPASGGGQVPYWFEENLFAFLRESDLLRIKNANLLSEASKTNPFSIEILDTLTNSPGAAWLALSWRQYLYAFADLEDRIVNHSLDIPKLLLNAENKWLFVNDSNILMEEARNNGEWVRIWRRALIEYPNF